MLDISLWYLFPISIIISSIAMMMGIGGAVLFSPLFIVVLQLKPVYALASGIIIEFFGFSSGLIGYLRQKIIPFSTIKELLIYTISGTILGVILAQYISGVILKILLLLLILYLAISFLLSHKKCIPKTPGMITKSKSKIVTIDPITKILSGFGGISLGLISSGLGEVNEYNFLERKKLSPSVAAGSSVFLVAISAIVSILFHMGFIIFNGELGIFKEILSIIIFSVPGVIIGAQFGVVLSKKFDSYSMELFAGILFLLISLVLFGSIIVN